MSNLVLVGSTALGLLFGKALAVDRLALGHSGEAADLGHLPLGELGFDLASIAIDSW